MIDYKEERCGRKLTEWSWKDFLLTVLIIATVSALFAAVIWETGRTGGAIDKAFGIEAPK